jgi:uncharacterized membrane protein YraQ (UPF0718 family)
MAAWLRQTLRRLDKTLLLLAGLVLAALAVALYSGGWQQVGDGFGQAGNLAKSVWIRLLLGFTLGGLVRVLLPSALIARWLGHASGLRGLLIGSYLGIILPGGPYVVLPIIASIYSAGAGVGPIIALLTGRALLGVQMLVVWQIPFLGAQLPLARYIVCLVVPPLVGLAGGAIFRLMGQVTPAIASSAAEPGTPVQAPEED